MKRLILIMLTTCSIALLSGCGKVDKTIEQSENLVQSSDYAGAIQSVELLGEEELSDEQRSRIEAVYTTAAEATEEYQDRVDVLESGIRILPDSEEIKALYIATIKDKVSFYEEGSDYVGALNTITHAKEVLPEDETVKALFEEVKSISDERQPYVDTLIRAKELIDASDWQGLADYSVNDESLNLSSFVGDEGSFIYIEGGGSTGDAIALYSMKGCDCIEWYVGTVTDGIRDGNGGWYWARSDVDGLYYEYYEGEFGQDKPNGTGKTATYTYDRAYEVTGTYEDGLENGDMSLSYTDPEGMIYLGKYKTAKGIAEVSHDEYAVERDRDGYYTHSVLRREDGGRIHLEKSSDGQIHGVAHFR